MIRCPWLDLTKPDYVLYHDREWGVPEYNDHKLFEHLLLESAQAGLSWYTVLRKREGYRQAFANFDPRIVANFSPDDVQRLLQDSGIIRHKKKIEAAIANSRAFLNVQDRYGSFAAHIWSFVDGRPIVHAPQALADYQTTIPASDRLAKDLKQRGFVFLGSTTCYAFMQAMGLVNDHSRDCFRFRELKHLST